MYRDQYVIMLFVGLTTIYFIQHIMNKFIWNVEKNKSLQYNVHRQLRFYGLIVVQRVFAPWLSCPPALLALRGERSCTGSEQEYRLSKNGKSRYCTAIARCSEFIRGPFPTATVVGYVLRRCRYCFV